MTSPHIIHISYNQIIFRLEGKNLCLRQCNNPNRMHRESTFAALNTENIPHVNTAVTFTLRKFKLGFDCFFFLFLTVWYFYIIHISWLRVSLTCIFTKLSRVTTILNDYTLNYCLNPIRLPIMEPQKWFVFCFLIFDFETFCFLTHNMQLHVQLLLPVISLAL